MFTRALLIMTMLLPGKIVPSQHEVVTTTMEECLQKAKEYNELGKNAAEALTPKILIMQAKCVPMIEASP